jgi:arabinofuranan 3-O-arabinosyltransferase
MRSHILVSIVIPIYNGSKNLQECLHSILSQTYDNYEVIVNDDLRSKDNSKEISDKYIKKGLKIKYLRENISMAQGRKRGVEFSSGELLLHLDSDMILSKDLLIDCIANINKGFDALVIPEESFGLTFWANCRKMERKCYENVSQLESVRCVRRDVYLNIGGHNEKMVFSEDKDLDIRIRKSNYKIGRTKEYIFHNEGKLHLIQTLKKKVFYSGSADLFRINHPKEFMWQINPINRYILFIKNIKYLFISPKIYFGLIFMKTCEFCFGGIGYLVNKIKKY